MTARRMGLTTGGIRPMPASPLRVPLLMLLSTLALLSLCAGFAPAQPAAEVPFQVGEKLTYRVRVAKLGTIGQGTMWIEGPAEVRGQQTMVLRSDFRTRVGLVRAVNHSWSWLDARRMAALRFTKHERQPLSKHDETVDMFPAERRWESADGDAGSSPTDAPLDELSFIYFIRTLPLEQGATYRFDRHFDAARNPITVTVTGRERIVTNAGEFDALLVEMRVRDPARYRGEGIIRLAISDDGCRIPVRIESSMPIVGTAEILLEAHSHISHVARQ